MSDLTTAVSGTSLDRKKWTLLNQTGEWADVTFIPWQYKWGPKAYNCGEDVKTVDCIINKRRKCELCERNQLVSTGLLSALELAP